MSGIREMLQFYVHIVLFCQSAQVDYGVAHTTQGSVDTYAGACCDVLEIAFAIVSQDNHASLFGRQHFNEFADIRGGLLAYYLLFRVFVL